MNHVNDIPKVLIFEHPPINKEGIGKTLYAFFANWPKEKLGQVYSVDLPTDNSLCNYYYINEVTKNSFEGATKGEPRNHDVFYRALTSIAHSKIGVVIRSVRYGKFLRNNHKLRGWENDFHPDIIFYGLGESVEENRYIYELYNFLNCSLVTYISDDYLAKWNKGRLLRRYYKELKQSYDSLIQNSKTVVLISESMRKKYAKSYPLSKLFVAQNALNRMVNNDNHYLEKRSKELRISYTGNLGLGRWSVISEIAQEIESINYMQKDWKIILNIYSPTHPSKRIIKEISNNFCSYRGCVSGRELDNVRLESDVLLFVESFNKKYREIVETAMSTKVPEYLSYGRIILSVGPEYSCSCKYMEKNDVAVCIYNQDDIRVKLLRIVDLISSKDKEVFTLLNNSKLLLAANHDFCKNANCFMDMMIEAKS